MSWLPTLKGETFDLVHPHPDMVDFADVAFTLARLPRFLGRTRGAPYSVAQHCVLGAEALLEETGDPEVAAAFLLHDAHEAFIGDIPAPAAEAIAWYDFGNLGIPALKHLKRTLDDAIFAAAGLSSAYEVHAALVAEMDLRLCRAERDALKGPSKRAWHPSIETARPIPSLGAITPWDWPTAEACYRGKLQEWLPQTMRRAA